MQFIMLTHNTVKSYFDSTVLDCNSSQFDLNAKKLIQNVISDMTGIFSFSDCENVSPYLTFIYMILNLHSTAYTKATSNDSGVAKEHLDLLMYKLRNLAPNITLDQILVADKMDILYGTQHRMNHEYSKFSVWFYEHVYEIAINTIEPDQADLVYEQAVSIIELVVSLVEQNILFLGHELDLEDMIVFCVYPFNGALFFITD